MRSVQFTRLLSLAAIILLIVASLSLPASVSAKPFSVEKSTSTFVSGGKKIGVEWFLPKDQKRCPAVVLLHDSAGLNLVAGPVFRGCAEAFAREGYVVMLVHYFDSTGMTGLTPEQVKKSEKHWPAWKNAVRDAVKEVIGHPQVDKNRVGLLGFSLGAYLSLAVANDQDMKIAAVAEFFGALPAILGKEPRKLSLPPTLIIHGLQDAIVPIKDVYALTSLLAARKIPFEMKLYNCGHLFLGTQLQWQNGKHTGSLLDLGGDIGDARELTFRFFARHLKKKS